MVVNDIRAMLEEGVSVGAVLCGERHTLGKSIEDVSGELKIKAKYIEAIEANDVASFERTDMISGMIRTYAKYLNFDPKDVLEYYRRDFGLKTPAGELGKLGQISSAGSEGKVKTGKVAPPIDFKSIPKSSGIFDGMRMIGSGLAVLLPIVLIVGLVGGAGYAGYNLLMKKTPEQVESAENSEVQAVDIVGDRVQVSGLSQENAPSINYEQLYERQALTTPIYEPLDGPIAQLSQHQGQQTQSASVETAQVQTNETPIVTVGPVKPALGLLPLGETWVQIKTEGGDLVLETLLKPGEFVDIPLEGDIKLLKAGNATELFMRVNGQVYGPVGQDGQSVVRNMPMLPDEITNALPEVSTERLEELRAVEGAYVAELNVQ